MNAINKLYKHYCEVCDKAFKSTVKNALRCSDRCRDVALKENADERAKEKAQTPAQIDVKTLQSQRS